MRKLFLCLFFQGLLFCCLRAQSFDKTRVTDYFQDQLFEDAIDYLSPLLRADSSNLPMLGYAYYMDDKTREAGDCYQRMLVLDSNNTIALHYLVLLRSGEETDEAMGVCVAAGPVTARAGGVVGEGDIKNGGMVL